MDSESEIKPKDLDISNNDEHASKKGRHRKKQLYNSILQQMEFYFSDSNLTKDRFLSQLLQQSPHVELNVFLKFNKIRKLTSNIEDIKKAVKKSQIIELSEDGNSICRKAPIKEKTNVDECTIYVERLKSDATHEWVSSVFSEFGNVVYVSIPKYKHNNAIKGFAFVEFDKEAEAEKALNYFETIGCRMPVNAEPEQLCSISTFENDENRGKKRKISEVEGSEGEEKEKKLKTENGDASETEDDENKKKKKLKKEHKKKNFIKELGLQVLSKKEWKRMRNRYLDMQRKKMKEFKKHLFKAKYGQTNYEEKKKDGAAKNKSEEIQIRKEKKDVTENIGDKNKPKEDKKVQEKNKLEEKKLQKNVANKETSLVSKLEFKKGVIVKLKHPEPIVDLKKIKNEIKALSSDIMYVDIPNPGSEDIYLRFSNTEGAQKFCTKEFGGKKTLLQGEEEQSYWKKIQTDREGKFSKMKKKERGRDKLLKKAKHIKFDD